MKYKVHYSAGFVGTDEETIVEADSEEEAVEACIDEAWEHYYSYGENEDNDCIEPELDIWAEPYEGEEDDNNNV